jgi:hypothetical protein
MTIAPTDSGSHIWSRVLEVWWQVLQRALHGCGRILASIEPILVIPQLCSVSCSRKRQVMLPGCCGCPMRWASANYRFYLALCHGDFIISACFVHCMILFFCASPLDCWTNLRISGHVLITSHCLEIVEILSHSVMGLQFRNEGGRPCN